ncbi:hypothetical protein A5642_22495 [Mycolicibacterium mucogenicum]|uniref:O-antigen/teichoic acid export membrane protein n=1 Tax=Mycolicibacterium mucogenicum TaxID=56689 RepID=A0A1A0MN62_MYCMU|nr:hypothetical protein [Mycolicibacterium mucogenicum]OBA86511.1 hypothetical protein A5642_22495 [Mycolicibacterium mucogenicum]
MAALTTIDQVLSSASNALMLFVLGQVSSVDQFAKIGILVALVFTFLGFNRGGLGTPVLLVSNMDRSSILAESGYAMSWALLTSVVAAAPVLLVTGAVLGEWTIASAFALAVPFALVQDVLRMACIALGRPAVGVLSDGFWVAWMAALFVANLLGAKVSPLWAVGYWGIGAIIAVAIPMAATGVTLRSRRLVGWWLTYWRARVRFGGVWAANQLGVALVLVTATAFVGSAAAAGLRGAWALFGPIGMLVGALPLVFVPHARRAGSSPSDQWRLLVKTSIVMSGLTLIATGVLVLTPPSVGAAILGSSWQPATDLVPYVGCESAMLCWVVSVFSYLQARGLSAILARVKAIQLGLQLNTCAIVGAIFATPSAIGWGLAGSAFITALYGVVIVRRTQVRDKSAKPRLSTAVCLEKVG